MNLIRGKLSKLFEFFYYFVYAFLIFFAIVFNLICVTSFSKNVRQSVFPSASENRNSFEYGRKNDLYVYLSDKESNTNFDNYTKKLWIEKNIDYSLLHLKKFNPTNNNWMWNLDCKCDRNGTSIGNPSLSDCDCNFNSDKYLFLNKKYGPYSKDHNNLLKSNNLIKIDRNEMMYLHVYIVEAGHQPDEEKLKNLHRVKKLNLKNWISNYTINLIDHREDINEISGSILNKLINYDPITGNYTPALSIDNSENNYELISNSTQLPLNLKFNQINFCEFIIYSCNQSSKDKQLNQICFEQSSKLSTNLIYFMFAEMPDTSFQYSFFSLLIIIIIPALLDEATFFSWCFNIPFSIEIINYKTINLAGFSTKLMIFDLFRSIIILLFELKRFPYSKCNSYGKNFNFFMPADNDYHFFMVINLIVIVFCLLNVMISLYKYFKVFKISLQYPIEYDKSTRQTRQYDNLAFKYLSLIMIPLFIIYSIYSFHNYYHKNLYHFIINTLYGYLLNFGFIAMTSQVYINHKLKETSISYEYYFYRISSLKFAPISFVEDLIDYHYKYREPFKFIYLREELIFLILLLQLNYFRKKPIDNI